MKEVILSSGYHVYPGDKFKSRKHTGSIPKDGLVTVEGIKNGRILVDIGAYALTTDDFERIFGAEPDRITDAVNKAVVLRTDKADFPYNVQIWTSIKGGPFLYCGNGKFCRTEEEIRQTVLKYRALSVEHADERHIGGPVKGEGQ